MSGEAANQHIEMDGGVVSRQVSALADAAATFGRVGAAVDRPLSGDAFGLISQGLLVPTVTALAGRSRELLDTAQTLADRMSTATDAALRAFDTLETNAVEVFRKDAS